MKINESLKGADLTMLLDGNFDDVNSPAIEKRLDQNLMKNDIKNICFDLAKVKYISSAGIRVLIAAHKKAIKTDKRVLIGAMSVKVQEILDMVGILRLFTQQGR
ncbi:MAG: STAS domain-containing protein [Candidatus Omnitrophota bacterium]